ncbi:SDR family NAD(P)-dependent oxidoreductase [Mesorhizobium sp. CN2-181]|uniref:SDR family NAD(P)-dependent oxidoreductase n=1 Tax=Mesorhizobium yinganensis TaxID=3157707 RepID=UPI0032B77FAE
MPGEFSGKVAAITGAGRGIGDAIAARLIEEGAKVFSFDLNDPDEARAGVTYLKVDVADPGSVEKAFGAIDRETGQIDVLVNNAGVQRVALAENMRPEDWHLVLNTHLTGMHLCCAQAIRRMRARGRGGAIVSIASAAGIVGIPGRGPYSAAKAGIEGLTRVYATETAAANIRVNAVAPGSTRTKLIEQGLKDGSIRGDWQIERIPMGRLAEPWEIADPVVYLASDRASYITGQTLVVDGGWTVQGMVHIADWLVPPPAVPGE